MGEFGYNVKYKLKGSASMINVGYSGIQWQIVRLRCSHE